MIAGYAVHQGYTVDGFILKLISDIKLMQSYIIGVQAKAATNTLQSLRLTVAAAAGYGSCILIKHLSTISNQKNKMQWLCHAYLPEACCTAQRTA
jgi:hypothetical protein